MKTIEEQIAEHEAAIAELKKQRDEKPKRVAGWRPKLGEAYHLINDCGSPTSTYWYGDTTDLWRLSQNNVFRTKDDALAYRKICTRAQDLIEKGERIDWENTKQNKWFFYYNSDVKGIESLSNMFLQYPDTTYFLKPEFEKIKDEFDDDTIMLFVGLR